MPTPAGYCPRCGQPATLQPYEDQTLPTCTACPWIGWIDPKLVAVALLWNEAKEILLIRRGIEPHLGEWALPGGFVGPHEHPFEAAEREAEEELNCTVILFDLPRIRQAPLTPDRGVIIIGNPGEISKGTPSPTEEALEVRFFPLSALPEIAFPTHADLIKTLE